MRKWTYLVAALLIGGVSTSLTSCIDTDEPAGITDLRGAKAELLRAKAQVELAEAAIRNAKAAWEQAQADLAAEKVIQEKLYTEQLQAQTENEKQRIQAEMEKRAEDLKKELLEKQLATAQAQAAYDKAIADIEVAMAGYKENAYAQALYNLLNNNAYTFTVGSGANATTITMKGLKGVSTELTEAKNALSALTRQLVQMEFSFDKATVIASVQSQLATEQGILAGMKENLALYQDILNTENGDLGKLTARHEELKKKTEELDKRENELKVAQEESLKPIREEQAKLDAENAVLVESQFAVPEEIQHDVYLLAQAQVGASGANVALWQTIINEAQLVDGKATYPNGITFKNTNNDLFTILSEVISTIENERIYDEGEISAQQGQQAQYKAEMERYITGDAANPGIYEAAVKAWTDAKKAYTDAYNAGNYSDPANNARALAIKDYEQFLVDKGNAADAAALGQVYLAYRTKLKGYLTARKALDGFVPVDASGTEIKACDYDTELDKFIALNNHKKRFGSDIAAGTVHNNTSGNTSLYYTYTEAANALGYTTAVNPTANSAQQVEKTFEEWLAAQTGISYPYAPTGTVTTTDRAYAAKYNYETVTSIIEGQKFWTALIANANNDLAEVQEKVTAAQAKQKEIDAATEKVLTSTAADMAQITQERTGISNIQAQLEAVLNDALGTSGASFDNLIGWVKEQVATLQGGEAGVGNDEYWFNTDGSIPAQEAVVNSYTKLVDDLKKDDSTYELAQERAIEAKKEAIAWQQTVVDGLQAIFDELNELKDQYIAGMTGEATPEVPDEGEGGETETPAE